MITSRARSPPMRRSPSGSSATCPTPWPTARSRSISSESCRAKPRILPHRPRRPSEVLARKTARWAADNADRIAGADPDMPPGVHNREADNWRPLFAIADAAGGEWPKRAWAAATQAAAASETDSLIELLLGDIRDIFAKRKANKVEPADRDPVRRSGRRPGCHRGTAMGRAGQEPQAAHAEPAGPAAQAAGIAPENIRIGDKVPKGYLLERFKEAFSRYLGPEGPSEPLHRYNADEMGTSDLFQTATAETDVAVRKCEKPNNNGHCSGVADEKEGRSEARVPRAETTEGQPDDIPTDQTCAQCQGETRRHRTAGRRSSGRAVWLHDVCERFWVRAPTRRRRAEPWGTPCSNNGGNNARR